MARITFQKRQKEIKRKEKQQLKAEKRAQRKIAKSVEPEAAEQNFRELLATFVFDSCRNLPGSRPEYTHGDLTRFTGHHTVGPNRDGCL